MNRMSKIKHGWAPSSTKGKVYAPPPVLYGGTQFVLVDLNEPIPEPDGQWLRDRLAQLEKACEFPTCDATAVAMIKVGKYMPYLCRQHCHVLLHGDALDKRVASGYITRDMVDAVLGTSFGREEGTLTRKEVLALPDCGPVGTPGASVAQPKSLNIRPFGQL